MSADYVITGSWAKKALDDAKLSARSMLYGTARADNYIKIPAQSELKVYR